MRVLKAHCLTSETTAELYIKICLEILKENIMKYDNDVALFFFFFYEYNDVALELWGNKFFFKKKKKNPLVGFYLTFIINIYIFKEHKL